MKKIVLLVLFAVFSFLLVFSSCGVSKDEYNRLYDENVRLKQELEQYENGSKRTIALLERYYAENDLPNAKKALATLEKYHPEDLGKNEVKNIILAIEKTEAQEAEKLKAARNGFTDPHAETADIFDVYEAAFLAESGKLTVGAYYIIRPCRTSGKQGGDIITLFPPNDADAAIHIKTDTLYKWVNENTRINALLKYSGKPAERYFDVVELIKQ